MWRSRGVRFEGPPQSQLWGGTFARFMDVDGNSFELIASDEMSREIEAQRRAAADKQEAERRAGAGIGDRKTGTGQAFPTGASAIEDPRLRRRLHSGPSRSGDYYDFLALGPERLGLLIGDISGKGIAAALLMANLQANLRSQFGLARDEPQIFLQSVNQLFYENTVDSAYATVFFAEYDGLARRLRYTNCGHLSGLLLRRDGTLERLHSTGTFWVCSRIGRAPPWNANLTSGDTLALYTDGVTESFNDSGRRIRRKRLAEALTRHREQSARRSSRRSSRMFSVSALRSSTTISR